ncbi:MAG: phosphoenolpyruvate--protein phosphotransferase [Gammaproteobacteria bacterium]|nr:phosphoenolpyruvate--protein phosphotransferase [Gammaproteobacteria bacterium]
MLAILQKIVQEVNRARSLDDVLSIIVDKVHEAMDVDTASVYLTDFDREQHVLMATAGEGVGEGVDSLDSVRLNTGEGVVGLVARRAEPINLADASKHTNYKKFAGIDYDQFHAFLGVPIIHQRNVLGVLVVQRAEKKSFREDSVAFLVTLAAQLAGAIAHAEARGKGRSIEKIKSSTQRHFFRGQGSAPGVGIGTAVVIYPSADLMAVPDKEITDTDTEIFVYQDALARVVKDIEDMKERLGDNLKEDNRVLFDAYALLVNSDTIVDDVIEKIKAGNWAPGSLRDVITETSLKFKEMKDPYLRERADDILDLGQRIFLNLIDKDKKEIIYPKKTVLVGENIRATDLAEAPIKNIVAVVSNKGSSSSHIAILARAMDIPVVMGADGLDVAVIDTCKCIVDGYQGRLYIDPEQAIIDEYSLLEKEEGQLARQLKSLRKLPAETSDGKKMPLYVNTGLMADIGPSKKSGAEGVGLYRTEFPFMIRDSFPGEEEQSRIYRKTLSAFAPRPVTLRTLDVGGDKALPYFPIEEENPFLGWRGIRITLDHREIFLTQIRGMLRGAIGFDNLSILLPMISDLSELDEAVLLIDQAFTEMQDEGLAVTWPKIGAMIEVPSAVYQAEELAQRVDYLSIGTNDLTQYLLAVDRNNARVAKLYDSLHPAVLRAINQTVDAGHKYGRAVGVCGEMAGDPAAAILLLGMGVDNLSMAVASLPRVKWVIRSFSYRDARLMLTKALQFNSARETRNYLNSALDAAGLGGLIRAGKK